MGQPSFRVDDEVSEFVESRLIAGQSKSVWYRYAVRSVMQCEPMLDEIYEKYEYEKRQELIEKAVREKVDEIKQSADKEP